MDAEETLAEELLAMMTPECRDNFTKYSCVWKVTIKSICDATNTEDYQKVLDNMQEKK